MSRYLGIDYGTVRIGIALTDPMKILASPFKIIDNTSLEYVISEIKQIIAEKKVQKVVVGMPYNMDHTIGFQGEIVQQFVDELKKAIEIPIMLEDERKSSTQITEAMSKMNVKKKHIDDKAAAVILQNYIDFER